MKKKWRVIIGGLIVLIPVVILSWMPAKQWWYDAAAGQCASNKRIISNAKAIYAQKNNLKTGARVTEENVAQFIYEGIPKCRCDGTYILNPVDVAPACTYHNPNAIVPTSQPSEKKADPNNNTNKIKEIVERIQRGEGTTTIRVQPSDKADPATSKQRRTGE